MTAAKGLIKTVKREEYLFQEQRRNKCWPGRTGDIFPEHV